MSVTSPGAVHAKSGSGHDLFGLDVYGAGRAATGCHFDRKHEIGGTKRLLQTCDVGQFGCVVDKVEHGHARYRDDRKIQNAFAHLHDDFETVRSLQKNVDDRQVELGSFELFQPRRGVARFNYVKMIDPQHDGDHRAYIRLVVDHENAGQSTAHGIAPVSLQSNLRFRAALWTLSYIAVKTRLRHLPFWPLVRLTNM